jgi:hypothetical protein
MIAGRVPIQDITQNLAKLIIFNLLRVTHEQVSGGTPKKYGGSHAGVVDFSHLDN